MSNSLQQQHQPQPIPLSDALSQLKATRIELEQSRERLFTLRTAVDLLISRDWEENSKNSVCVSL